MIDIEKVDVTGKGVYVAVLDTGLVANWKDYFPDERVAQEYGAGFYQNVTFKASSTDGCELDTYRGELKRVNYIGSRGSSHGTHVASTIIGYNYYSNSDAAQGYPLPPIQVRGIAPDATIIPVKVLADYQVPAMPKCDEPTPSGLAVFGTEEMVAAGIDYVTDLKLGPLAGSPIVINMSLGGEARVGISAVEKAAIDRAIDAGVIVVAAASNDGELGMSSPGSYPPVISAGAVGWIGEWLPDGASGNAPSARYRMWWLQNMKGTDYVPGSLAVLKPGSGDVAEGGDVIDETYVTDFSSREIFAGNTDGSAQDLDVLAPGSWVRGPFAGTPGYNHLPWWSNGIADLVGNNTGNFYYVGGTSMASPHVASVAALMLEADSTLVQGEVEAVLRDTAIDFASTGSRMVWDPFLATPAFVAVPWDEMCDVDGPDASGAELACDPVGYGLVQADAAVAAVD
jgi:subtilisin family serine protease